MTTLAIMATYEKKRLKCYGTVAAGEHVAVTVTDGAQWIGEGKALRLRVLFGPNTVAVFPFADGDAWIATGQSDFDAYCELNLNTLQAAKYLKCGGPCLWILDDVENHTLYATGEFDILPWPKRRGVDEPIDLDGYPQLVEDMEELKAAWTEYQTSIAQQLAAKQDVLSDLAAIRNGAAAGTTAIQPSMILDGDKIKPSFLPSYVDDVIEVENYAALPEPGEKGKIYVTLDTNKTYRWGGTAYVEISNPDLSNYATKADATLTERTDFTDWTIIASQPTLLRMVEGRWVPFNNGVAVGMPKGDETSTSLSWHTGLSPEANYDITATRLVKGYQLGDQDDKPLASEAEAEALRNGKLDKSGEVWTVSYTDGGLRIADDAGAHYIEINPGGIRTNYPGLHNVYWPVNGGMLALLQNLAPNFSTASTYALNALCVHEGVLYRCTNAITTAEDWTPAHWTQATVEDVLAILRGKFAEYLPRAGGSLSGDLSVYGDVDIDSGYMSIRNGNTIIVIDQSGIDFSDDDAQTWRHFDWPSAAGTLALVSQLKEKVDDAAIAPEFSTASTYAVDDVVMHEGLRYKCTTAVTTAGAWTGSTNWTAATVEDVLAALRTALAGKADVSAIPYNLVTKTISNGAVSLDDRAINAVAVSSSLASLTVNFPTATSGKARDFGLRLTVASGITTAPELALPQGVVCENADGEAPEIGADGAATILYFTETASGVFLVKGEVVTAIS